MLSRGYRHPGALLSIELCLHPEESDKKYTTSDPLRSVPACLDDLGEPGEQVALYLTCGGPNICVHLGRGDGTAPEVGEMTRQLDDRVRSVGATVIAVILLLLPQGACAGNPADLMQDSGNPTVNPSGNLIPNGSFEQGGQATLDTWQVSNPSAASLTPQAAPGGGNWSLRLQADGAPTTSQVRFQVPGLEDGAVVRLSGYVQATAAGGGGLIGLEVTAADGRIRQKSFASSQATAWTRVGVTEKLALEPGDTVWVVLRAPPTELSARAGLFDLVTLERL